MVNTGLTALYLCQDVQRVGPGILLLELVDHDHRKKRGVNALRKGCAGRLSRWGRLHL